MTAEQQKIYDEYIQDDIDIDDLDDQGWTCLDCPKPRHNKSECNFQDCLTFFILSGRRLTKDMKG